MKITINTNEIIVAYIFQTIHHHRSLNYPLSCPRHRPPLPQSLQPHPPLHVPPRLQAPRASRPHPPPQTSPTSIFLHPCPRSGPFLPRFPPRPLCVVLIDNGGREGVKLMMRMMVGAEVRLMMMMVIMIGG